MDNLDSTQSIVQIMQSQTIVQNWGMEVVIGNSPIIMNNAVSTALLVESTPVGELAATNVQAAIAELDSDINSIGDLSTLFDNKLI